MGYRPALFVGAVLAIATPAHAGVYCRGTVSVSRILTYANGDILVNPTWRGDFIKICNLKTAWKGADPTACFAWMSKIASAISFGKPVGFWYELSNPIYCSTLPTYQSSPAPVYVDVAP